MPLLSPKTHRRIARIAPFGVIWFVVGLVFLMVEQAMVAGDVEQGAGRGLGRAVDLDLTILLFATVAHVTVGLIVGAIEVLFLDRAFARHSFPRKIVYKVAFYVALFAVVTLVTFPIAVSLELDSSLTDARVWRRLGEYLVSPAHLSTDLQLAAALGVSLFYSAISDYVGHGVLVNFFAGRYHHPKGEERAFMFADMKSSTPIAEELGHVRFFELLADYYADLADAIVASGAEVYKYVGDEIILSWPVERGRVTARSISCFFSMQDALAQRAGYYEQAYGLVPTFKAGIHCGAVTTGEIGAIKKEIMFTGDVPNTTARLQGLCNELGESFLASGRLLDAVELPDGVEGRRLGSHALRGRDEELEVYGLSRNLP